MAGAILRYLLREPRSKFLFILDGLDEHHALTRLSGLQRLSNQLAEFSGPVIVTTRREHLEAMFGDFSTAFSELGRKFGAARRMTALYLDRWTSREVRLVIEQAARLVGEVEKTRLKHLLHTIDAGSAPYGDLIYQPLFLQFILEDVAEGGGAGADRPALIHRWIRRKILRDRETWAPVPSAGRALAYDRLDTEEYVAKICSAMASIATATSVEQDGRRQLVEGLPGKQVMAIVDKTMNAGSGDLLSVLLNSVLTTLGPRRGEDVQVGFALRILHEYFAAADLVRREASTSEWPLAVQTMAEEIRSSSGLA
jgi:hypothetical protein